MNRERLMNVTERIIDRVTGETALGSLVYALGFTVLFTLAAFTVLGIITGGSAAIDGEPIAETVIELRGIETEVWGDMAGPSVSPIARSIYGLVHWFVAITVSISVVAVHIGYQAPILAYAMKYVGQPVVVGLLALMVVNLIDAGIKAAVYTYERHRRASEPSA